jgi:hypothetical protein
VTLLVLVDDPERSADEFLQEVAGHKLEGAEHGFFALVNLI